MSQSTDIGAVLDVSYSMKSNIGDGVDEDGGNWARSLFTVIDDLVKHDVSNTNRIFSVGVGGSKPSNVFDILGTIQDTQGGPEKYEDVIEEAFQILERNGAKTIRRWAKIDVVRQVLPESEARIILKKLKEGSSEFMRKFVYEWLPTPCREWSDAAVGAGSGIATGAASAMVIGAFAGPFGIAVAGIAGGISGAIAGTKVVKSLEATDKDIKKVVTTAMNSPEIGDLLKRMSESAMFSVHKASDILHGCVDEKDPKKDLTKERAKELLKSVEPFIYGQTPLFTGLGEAMKLFSQSNHRKLLLVLSDGLPTDIQIPMIENADSLDRAISQQLSEKLNGIQPRLQEADVTVVCCYIQQESETNVQPRRLYNVADGRWEKQAQFMFNLSSKIPTELLVREIFVKQGWEIDITNNETRLFVQVNHPDHLKDVCKLARNAVCCSDALSDLLVSVDLDIYINQQNSSAEAPYQEGYTCYANASATVLHLAMHRILGRSRPPFQQLRDEMIRKYGIEGANTFRVLRRICPEYKLQCRKTDVNGAMEAIAAKRLVVARFELTHEEWFKFRQFYRSNRTGILTQNDLDVRRRSSYDATTSGHAVVLTSFNSECFRLMNSWGDTWGDNGFFKVESAEILGLEFIDVYWELDDLSLEERQHYDSHGAEVARKLMESLKALKKATYPCPNCRRTSDVAEFRGTLSRAKCPKCSQEFSSLDVDGNILALNVHLTSLAQQEQSEG